MDLLGRQIYIKLSLHYVIHGHQSIPFLHAPMYFNMRQTWCESFNLFIVLETKEFMSEMDEVGFEE